MPDRRARALNDVQPKRKQNLRELIAQEGGPTNLARKLRYGGPSYLSQMIGEAKPITEKTARMIESVLALPHGWMDTDHSTPVGGIGNLVGQVVTVLETALVGHHLPPARMAALAALCCEHAAEQGHVDEGYIRRLVALVVANG